MGCLCQGEYTSTQKKDEYRRLGKGRRCYLEARIDLIPCRTTILRQDEMKKWMSSSYSSNRPSAKQLAQQGIESILAPKQRQPLPFLLFLSLFYTVQGVTAEERGEGCDKGNTYIYCSLVLCEHKSWSFTFTAYRLFTQSYSIVLKSFFVNWMGENPASTPFLRQVSKRTI